VLCACGRLGFDPRAATSSGDGAVGDVPSGPNGALRLGVGGQQGYVLLGSPASLRLDSFTIEMWIRREGDGITASSGNLPLAINPAVPLLTKGRGEADGDETVDINYFVALLPDMGFTLGMDYEEGAAGPAPSDNHPIRGTMPIGTGTWHHVAFATDGTRQRLYVDGALDFEMDLGAAIPPAMNSQVQAVIGGASNSNGDVNGAFDGAIDELRVWQQARDEAQIQALMNRRVSSATDLLCRFGFDEGSGVTVVDSVGGVVGQIEPPAAAFAWEAGPPLQ
jgi:hypothetical protein